MKNLLSAAVIAVVGLALAGPVLAEVHVTDIPDGVEPVQPGDWQSQVPCDIELRYDDGTDDSPGSGPTLARFADNNYWHLGVRFAPPAGGDYLVQSASWFSDFWVTGGNVEVKVYEAGNEANTTSAMINVTGGGTWEVEFADPICIPAGGEYHVVICPSLNVWGVIGEDYSAPDGRSYQTGYPGGCTNQNPIGVDLMLWSCVTPCGPTPVETTTWGAIKSIHQ